MTVILLMNPNIFPPRQLIFARESPIQITLSPPVFHFTRTRSKRSTTDCKPSLPRSVTRFHPSLPLACL
jgi:hypothetical protein